MHLTHSVLRFKDHPDVLIPCDTTRDRWGKREFSLDGGETLRSSLREAVRLHLAKMGEDDNWECCCAGPGIRTWFRPEGVTAEVDSILPDGTTHTELHSIPAEWFCA